MELRLPAKLRLRQTAAFKLCQMLGALLRGVDLPPPRYCCHHPPSLPPSGRRVTTSKLNAYVEGIKRHILCRTLKVSRARFGTSHFLRLTRPGRALAGWAKSRPGPAR